MPATWTSLINFCYHGRLGSILKSNVESVAAPPKVPSVLRAGIGDVTNSLINRHVVQQGEQLEVDLHNSREFVWFGHSCRESYFDLRLWSHCVAQYNGHLFRARARCGRDDSQPAYAGGFLGWEGPLVELRRLLQSYVHPLLPLVGTVAGPRTPRPSNAPRHVRKNGSAVGKLVKRP